MLTSTQIDSLKSSLRSGNKARVRYFGRGRTLFFNAGHQLYCMINYGCRRYGHEFSDFANIEKVLTDGSARKSSEEMTAHLVNKYKKLASKATFTNSWIRKIQAADPSRDLYENGITTGSGVDGKVISVESVFKYRDDRRKEFLDAVHNGTPWKWGRFPFRGYEATVEVWKSGDDGDGEVHALLSVERKDCGNGYYYLLVNDENFIGHDID